MGAPISRITDWKAHQADMIIDVRSPSEFADDHVPGAVNLPVMSDAERAEIGTMHKQQSPFAAKRAGAAIVARNIARHLEETLHDAPRDFRPVVYCWRGGQRSGAMARILSEIGWQTAVIDGGYKSYRKAVLDQLERIPKTLRICMLRGRTGTAKTQILRALSDKGGQIIDLEGLAAHRGSLLGPEPGQTQPSQRQFESNLTVVLSALDPDRIVFIEAESNKVGQIHIPPALWAAMCGTPTVTIQADINSRVAFLMRDYAHIIAEPDRLTPLLDWVVSRLGHAVVNQWRDHIAAGRWAQFINALLCDHYDPAYDRSSKTRAHEVIARLDGGALDSAAIDKAAETLRNMTMQNV